MARVPSATVARRLLAGAAGPDSGATVGLRGATVPTTGYVVGRPDLGMVCDGLPPTATVDRWLITLPADVAYVGSWRDNGRTYLDAVDIVADRDTAIAMGRARGELAIFDLEQSVTLTLMGATS